MPNLKIETSHLLLIDLQGKLMPAIEDGGSVTENARRLIVAARKLGVPISYTEQNPVSLGRTLPSVAAGPGETVLEKSTFDACRTEAIRAHLAGESALVIAGCEAHVCVLQTVLSLLEMGRRLYVVADATGSRREISHDRALARMAQHGAEIVTTEMVIFEWLVSSENPEFRNLSALIR